MRWCNHTLQIFYALSFKHIFTDRIRRMREGNDFSLSTPVGGGGEVPRPGPAGGGTPARGVPLPGGIPHLGYPPLVGPGRGYPLPGIVPHLRYTPPPPIGPHRGVLPGRGVPHLGYPPPPPLSDLASRGGTPCGGGGVTPLRETDGVLDTARSVCLLRSRRRTFLYFIVLGQLFLSMLTKC